ncbi:hypothetical protein ACNKHR_25280 [Shigella flexneri]
MVVVGISLFAASFFSSRTAATGGFAHYPAVFTFYLHICLLFSAHEMLAMVSPAPLPPKPCWA